MKIILIPILELKLIEFGFSDFLDKICQKLYDTLRPVVIHLEHLESLSEICYILKNELIDENILNQSELFSFYSSEFDSIIKLDSPRIGAIHQMYGTPSPRHTGETGLQIQYLHTDKYNWLHSQCRRPGLSRKIGNDEGMFSLSMPFFHTCLLLTL